MYHPRDLQFHWRHIIRAIAASGAVTLLAAGCSPPAAVSPQGSGTSPAPGTPAGASHEMRGEHEGHGDHGAPAAPSELTVVTMPATPAAGQVTELSLQILGTDQKTVTKFDILHEKLAHLIIVREGLDEFAHLHPDVSDDGTLRIKHDFGKAGPYRLFVDYQPVGGAPSLATGRLAVAGDDSPAAALTPNAGTPIASGDLEATVEITPAAEGTTIRFRITGADGKAIGNLQPYLGAMGHLVVIKSGTLDYVHAHPVGNSKTAPDGVVEFEAHLPSAGTYKAWGQFRHNERVLTFPVVLQIDAVKGASGGHKH